MHTFESLVEVSQTSSMRKRRLHRDRASATHNWRVTPQDIEVLVLLSQFKYLRTSHIRLLLPHRKGGLNESLRRMFDIGLITKPKSQGRGYNTLWCPDIYMLDTKGEDALDERDLFPAPITRLWADRPGKSNSNISHSMAICDTLVSIKAGAEAAGYEFVTWTDIVQGTDFPKPLKLPYKYSTTFRGKHYKNEGKLISDGLFGIRKNGKTAYFMLEFERKDPNTRRPHGGNSFLNKVLGYRDIMKTQVYKKQLNISNLRFLTVSPNATKSSNQCAIVEEIATQSHTFLFHPIPLQEDLLVAPPPFPSLFSAKWQRAGLPPITLTEGLDS